LNIFFMLLWKILPLYCNVLLGILASKYLKIDRNTIASLLIYIFGPMVVFSATMSVEINRAILILPIFFYLFSSILGFIYLKIFQNSWDDSTSNILAFTAGTGNTGYYGIALAIILFEPPLADIFIFTMLASLFYEATTGFYITAKGAFSTKESLAKVFRLPALYAFVLAFILNISGVSLPDSIYQYTSQFKMAFSILGMMLLGIGLKGLWSGVGMDKKFLQHALCAKHIVWPILICCFILLDKYTIALFNDDLYKVMFVFSIVPLAGNTVTLAILLKAQPEKAAIVVLISNIFSIVYIPLMLTLYEALWIYI
jgi:predicted permease